MEEIWKDIVGYENLYQVSNFGRVRSLNRTVWNHNGYAPKKGVVLVSRANATGHHTVNLSKNCKSKMFFVHRLVAFAFIPNPDNLPIINHKDENPSNNSVENLEWCTHKYNMNYGNRPFIGRAKCIKQVDENGNIVGRFRSVSEASRTTGISRGNISSVLNGGKYRHNAGNYKWVFDYETIFE